MTTLAFAADHAGYEMKQELINYARELDYGDMYKMLR